MTPSSVETTNPLGLNLDFMFGRGYLWASRERLSDWITLESLRMEIPDLSFPFDARGGLDRFRNTRCLVREIEFAISEVGLGDLLRQAAAQLDRFEDLQVRFLDDAVHISVRVRAFGSDTFVSFRAALIPPEPARADQIHLSLYDYRAYGPLPFPARLVAFELMTGLLNTPLLRPPGRGSSFTVGVAGDILSFRPLKLLLLHIFPHVGWKLPNLSGVLLDGARIRPGVLTIRASTSDERWNKASASQAPTSYQLTGTKEGARALAAYEAKDLFANADQALFDGQIRQAMELMAGYRDLYGLHTELVSRALDCLMADPSPSNLAEAESMCRELQADDPDDLRALMARPTIALVSGARQELVEHYDRLSEVLRDRGETADWILCQLAAAQHLNDTQPEEAASRLRQVLKASPRNRIALEALRELYTRLGEQSGLEEVLKRLTGVYTDRYTLKDTYLRLAHHLMDREGELAESRLYLEKVLRLDPSELDALDTLGESYVLSDEPLRALKAFGSAARAAEASDEPRRASHLLYRVARLWNDELDDTGQALLTCRRALSMWPADEATSARLEHAEVLEFAASLCEQRERLEEASDYWMKAIPLLEELDEQAGVVAASAVPGDGPGRQAATGDFAALTESADELDARLVRAHRELAGLYERRERPQAAASHLRRIIEIDPEDAFAVEHLQTFYRRAGQPEQLIELYADLLRRTTDSERKLSLHLELAELYESLHLVDDACEQLEEAVAIDPAADKPRRRLIDLLRREGRFEALRETLERLGGRVRQAATRRELSVALGEVLFEELGEYRNAARAFFEAIQIEATDLSALRKLVVALDKLIERDGPEAAAPAGSGDVAGMLERVLIKLGELENQPVDQGYAYERLAALASRRGDEARAEEARRRAEAAFGRANNRATEDVDARLDELLDDVGDSLATATEPEDTDDEASDGPKLDDFRKRYKALFTDGTPTERGDQQTVRLKKAPAASQEASAEATNAPAAGGDGEAKRRPRVTDEPGAPGEGASPAGRATEPSPRQALEAARATDRPADIAEALEQLIGAHLDDTDESVDLQPAELARLSHELGELYYYDLEDAVGAQPHLERVRHVDPEGLGSRSTLLTTLEAIYEERGEVDERIRILRARLDSADSEEMATTYRLLIAQIVWDERADAEEARRWLKEVLDDDPRHESAHRLLAQIARQMEDFEGAARHLQKVLKVAGGGLDAVELERELAELLLHELDRPEAARIHFEQVLEAAPGDSMALEGIKQCQASLADWRGYIDSLGHELGLLIGQPDGLDLEQMTQVDPDKISSAVRVPASQIVADAAHIADQDLQQSDEAWALWGVAFSLWPEHVEALERRIELERTLDKTSDLAEDLESYAELLLEPHARFEALVEAARLYADTLDEPREARPLFAEAIALVQDQEQPPQGLDQARRALRALQTDQDGS